MEDIFKTCFETPDLIANPDPDLTYTWIYPDGSVVNGIGLATMLGTYQVSALSASTGCLRNGTLEVFNDNQDNVGLPNSDFAIETKTCSNPNPLVMSSLSHIDYNFIWRGADIISGTSQNQIQVSEAGLYTVSISIPGTSCENLYVVEVPVDTTRNLPIISDSLNCVKDTATIKFDTDYTLMNTQWVGPGVPPTFGDELKVTMDGPILSVIQ